MKEGWTFTPFEDVCVSMTKGPFGSDIKKSLYVPKSADTYKVYIQVNAIEKDASLGEYFISKEYFDSKMSRFEVKPNDYIITCDGTLGRYLRLPPTMERGIISASLLRITLKTNILPRFFEYLWDGYIMSRLTSDIRNSALVHLPSATKIGKVLIPLPSIDEQERIIAELDLLQGIIDKQKVQLKELDTLAQSIFYDMFGDPVENERGWTVYQLFELVTEDCPISYGIVQPGDGEKIGVPVVRPVDLTTTFVHNNGLKLTTEAISNAYKRTILKGDELLLCVRGTTGIVSLAAEDLIGCNVSRGITPLRFKTANRFFMLYQFKTPMIQRIVSELTHGIALKGMNMSDVRKMRFICPPSSLQDLFGKKIESIERQKASINASIAETQKLFDYTMDKYFG